MLTSGNSVRVLQERVSTISKAPISLYIHIPFCKKKCPYCHFYVVQDNETLKNSLLAALIQELQLLSPKLANREIVSVYFGGGTPYLIAPHRIAKFMEAVSTFSSSGSCEVTIEANPETMDQSTLEGYFKAGVNRLSVGVQSFNDDELRYLGRTHSAERAIKAIDHACKAGFTNISIDLMYEVPHQTCSTWAMSLEIAKSLPITHISLYNLTIEPGTAFYRKKDEIAKSMPNDDDGLSMYQEAQKVLSTAKFSQYEISAFARDDLYSRHNTGYWTGREFLGLGPSAFSFFDNVRYSNVSNLQRYIQIVGNTQSPVDFREELDMPSRRRELLAVGLRLFWGIELVDFQNHFGKLDSESYTEIDKLEKDGLLLKEKGRLSLTDFGRRFYDTVASRLL